MSSKAFLFLALIAAFVLLITSEVAATRSSLENNNGEAGKETTGVDDGKYGGGYGDHGRHGGYGRGPGGRRGGYGGYRGRGGYGGRCAFGCCRSDYYGRGCRRCCSYPGQAVDAETRP
ncbi:Glycine-rich [Gossypium arboreum]|uniref:Glycine-rich n=2 Tax=Gossypium arboreum TaxID=29729 RepID=A0A0B0N6T6_GOSAR|nr:glycine-rich protein-like [Gossypium arboreum]KAK5818126.1 hypothetical protein PVK06_023057 [Gossypium arboreum]KHG06786.1 Glycine-rich [Gossypium arboreum]